MRAPVGLRSEHSYCIWLLLLVREEVMRACMSRYSLASSVTRHACAALGVGSEEPLGVHWVQEQDQARTSTHVRVRMWAQVVHSQIVCKRWPSQLRRAGEGVPRACEKYMSSLREVHESSSRIVSGKATDAQTIVSRLKSERRRLSSFYGSTSVYISCLISEFAPTLFNQIDKMRTCSLVYILD